MADATTTTTTTEVDRAANFQEPTPQTERRRSSVTKIVDAIKKPFNSSKKNKDKEELPPALQDAIDKMEARRQATMQKMEREGKDTKVLSGKRVDNIRNPLRG